MFCNWLQKYCFVLQPFKDAFSSKWLKSNLVLLNLEIDSEIFNIKLGRPVSTSATSIYLLIPTYYGNLNAGMSRYVEKKKKSGSRIRTQNRLTETNTIVKSVLSENDSLRGESAVDRDTPVPSCKHVKSWSQSPISTGIANS